MSISLLLIYKIVLTSITVVCLAFVAEYISPRWAGILSGCPTGTAITLYFYALENGLTFAGKSAIFNVIGLIAMQMFIYSYYISGLAFKKYKIIFSILGGFIGYSITVYLLSLIEVTPVIIVIITSSSIFLFKYLFQRIKISQINRMIKPTLTIIIFRAFIATLTICITTGIAKFVGHIWAGLFSAFPTTLFPLIFIIHYSYGEKYAYSIIKHVPDGLFALLIYSLAIYLCYPKFCLYYGILMAFLGAIIYLLIYQVVNIKFLNK